MQFKEIEADLRRLLIGYGPPRDSVHPEYPFWRLRNDGIWEVSNPESLVRRKSNDDVPVTELRRVGEGGFIEEVQRDLAESTNAEITGLVQQILGGHFPPSYHEPLAADAGLKVVLTSTRRMDLGLRAEVFRYAADKCDICGALALSSVSGVTAGLTVRHLHWVACGGPLAATNSLCLCESHAAGLDFGAVSLGMDLVFCDREGQTHRQLPPGRVDRAFAEWHRKNVCRFTLG